MSKKQWQIIGGDHSTTELEEGSKELGFRVRRLCGGLRDGVIMIDVICGSLRFSLLPSRGMGIWNAFWDDIEFGWKSPVAGPVHPSFVPIYDPSGVGWLDGFDELLARCGLLSNGAPDFDEAGRLKYPLHGRIANVPAQSVGVFVDEREKKIEIHGSVLESRFHFHKLLLTTVFQCQLGKPVISIQDSVQNLSSAPGTFQLLYHLNLGTPLLDAGSKFLAPIKEVAPRDIVAANAMTDWETCTGPGSHASEHVYFMKLFADKNHQTMAMLHNSKRETGVIVSFDQRELPCFSLWKNSVGTGDGFVVGLEPATNYPNIRSFEERRGRVIHLEAQESYGIHVELGFCCGEKSVQSQVDRIRVLQSEPPHLLNWPSAEYSPVSDLEPASA